MILLPLLTNFELLSTATKLILKFSQEAFRDISVRYPQVTAEITKIIIQRFRRSRDSQEPACRTVNICVLAVATDLSLEEFTHRLATELAALRSTLHLSSGVVDELLDTPRISQIAEDDPNAIRLETWLDEQESKYEYVLYESDTGDSNWTGRCLRQADRVLVVGNAANDPPLAPEDPSGNVVLPSGLPRAQKSSARMQGLFVPGGAERIRGDVAQPAREEFLTRG